MPLKNELLSDNILSDDAKDTKDGVSPKEQ